MKSLNKRNEESQLVSKLDLNQLPIYTQWIDYMLGLKKMKAPLNKSQESITREYDIDKWGSLLQQLSLKHNPTIFDADKFIGKKNSISPFYRDGQLLTASENDINNWYFETISNEITKYKNEISHIVELGAGYGSIILKLALLDCFKGLNLTAAEYTNSGVECLQMLSRSHGLVIDSGTCDLGALDLNQFEIGQSSLVFTCWAMACLKGFSRATLGEIIKIKPKVVIHFEPIFEHWDDDTLIHKMWKRYCQLNDYNQSMFSDLEVFESEGLIKILNVRKNVFGVNPLAPISIISWAPCD